MSLTREALTGAPAPQIETGRGVGLHEALAYSIAKDGPRARTVLTHADEETTDNDATLALFGVSSFPLP